jgi:hypothetical protein
MKRFCLCVATWVLSACSADDQRYLLTYEHTNPVHSTVAASGVPAISAPARAEASVEGPTPVQPAVVAPKVARPVTFPVESSPPSAAIATSEPPSSVPPPVAFVGTAQGAQAPAAPPPPVAAKATPPRASASIAESALTGPTERVTPAQTGAPPQAIVLKPAPTQPHAVPFPAPERGRTIPAMVRPAPPPPEIAAAPAISPPAQTTTAVAVSTAAGTSAAATTAPAAPPPPAYSERYTAHCKAVADQRALDAVSNGYDSEMEQQIFAGTYRNCMSWSAQHR